MSARTIAGRSRRGTICGVTDTDRIAVLGAGNGGQCMAADLALAGHAVVLHDFPEFVERLGPLADSGRIRMSGAGRTGVARLASVTADMAEAVADATLVNLVVPAFAQARFFDALVPHLRDGQVVVVWAGDYGSLALRSRLATERPGLSVQLVETNTLPYGTRLAAPGEVELPLLASRVLAAALPEEGPGLGLLADLWPCVEPGADVIGVALSNPNPVIHPPGALLNVGRIQYSGGAFNMYREGITEAVARVIRSLHEETVAVADGLGTEVLRYEDRDFRTKVSIMGVAFQAPFDTIGAIGDIAGPKSIQDRYITEDLPFGLVPLVELGRLAGVPTPLAESIVALGSAVCGRDFWTEGRGLEALGLGGLGAGEIMARVRGGVAQVA